MTFEYIRKTFQLKKLLNQTPFSGFTNSQQHQQYLSEPKDESHDGVEGVGVDRDGDELDTGCQEVSLLVFGQALANMHLAQSAENGRFAEGAVGRFSGGGGACAARRLSSAGWYARLAHHFG